MFSLSSSNRIKEFIDNTKDITFKNKEDFDIYFDECINLAYAYVIYYDKKRQSKQRQTVLFRLLIGITTAVALIFPLLSGVFDSIFTILSKDFAELGNKLLILSGILYAIQSYYGSTNGHIRYAKSQLELEKIISIYKTKQSEILASIKNDISKEDMNKLTHITSSFINEIFNTINDETNKWAKDLISNEKSFVNKYIQKK